MFVGLILLVGVIVAVVVAAARSHDPRGHGAIGSATPPGGSDLEALLRRWVEAGLLSEEQPAAIVEYERSHLAAPGAPATVVSGPAPPSAGRRIPVVAEALGYIGGLLAVIGVGLIVSQYWPDASMATRLALSGLGAAGLLGAGALVREDEDPAFARLRGFLWLGSTALAALFAGVVAVDGFDVGSGQVAVLVLVCGATVAVVGGLLWMGRERPLQQLACLGGAVAAVGGLVAELASVGTVGLALWAVGALYLVLGLWRRTSLPLLTEAVGAIVVVIGASTTVGEWTAFGLAFQVLTALGLVGIAVVRGIPSERADQLLVGVIGGVALVQAVPSAIGYFAGEEGLGLATGLVVWAAGAALVLIGSRGLVRVPVAAEALGGAALIGGAALTGADHEQFAPLFGIVTAIGLIALGMLPGQVLLSLFGSVGLLVNVPWAIGVFFPGEAQAPVLLVVVGALILMVAVLLTRMRGRFRDELGTGSHHPTVPA